MPIITRSNKVKVVAIENRMLELERHFEHEATERREHWSDLSPEVTALTNLIKGTIEVNDITLIFDDNEEKITLMDHLCLIFMTMKNNIVICVNKCFTSMAVVSARIGFWSHRLWL